jgi:hypothetical protein
VNGTAAVTVVPALGTQLQVNAPPTATAGGAVAVTVAVLDAYGNVATGFQDLAQFLSSDRSAVLPSAYVFQASDSGQHTFQVTLKRVGARTITVQAAGNHAVNGIAAVTVTRQ